MKMRNSYACKANENKEFEMRIANSRRMNEENKSQRLKKMSVVSLPHLPDQTYHWKQKLIAEYGCDDFKANALLLLLQLRNPIECVILTLRMITSNRLTILFDTRSSIEAA